MLLEAITAADQEVYQRKQKVAEEKWKVVAENLKASKPTTNYSQNACRNRFEALENDTATIPPELVDAPEETRVERAGVEVNLGAVLGGARRRHTNATFEGNGDASNDNHAVGLPNRGAGKSKAAANGRGEPCAGQLFPTTFPNGAKSRLVHEDMISLENDSEVDCGEHSDGNAQLSPEVWSSWKSGGQKFRFANASGSAISESTPILRDRVREEIGVSTISQRSTNATRSVGTAKAHPKGVAHYAHAASGKSNNSRGEPGRSKYRV